MTSKKDDTTLFGILGLCFSIIPIFGIIFAIASLRQAKKNQRDPTLGVVALILSIIIGIFSYYSFEYYQLKMQCDDEIAKSKQQGKTNEESPIVTQSSMQEIARYQTKCEEFNNWHIPGF